jgi:SNF2 family DNA or RNA helicase
LEIRAKHRWVVTATPVQNRIDDMFPYLNFLGIFESYGIWKRDVLDAMKSNPKKSFSALQAILKEIGLRRQNTILNLPKHQELRVTLPITLQLKLQCTLELVATERAFYDALFKYSQDRIAKILRDIDAFMNSKRNSRERLTKEDNKKLRKAKMNIMVMLLRLRQASCHPVTPN